MPRSAIRRGLRKKRSRGKELPRLGDHQNASATEGHGCKAHRAAILTQPHFGPIAVSGGFNQDEVPFHSI